MKKLFTLAAAVLASFNLWAAEPNFESYNWGADDFATVFADHDGIVISSDASAWKGNFGGTQYVALGGGTDMSAASPTPYFGVTAAAGIDSVEIYWAPNGGDATNLAWIAWDDAANFKQQEVDYKGEGPEYTGSKSIEGATWQMFDFSATDETAILFGRQLKKVMYEGSQHQLGKNKTVNILGVRVWLSNATPSTDPVTSVTIDGDAAGYVGRSVNLTATFDAKPDSIFWTVDGAVQENSNSKNFTLSLDAERTYQVGCWARNQYNEADQFAASQPFSVVATVKPALDQVSISEPTTWDWTKAASVSTIQWTTDSEPYQKNRDTVVMANIDGMNNNDEFNSQALLFNGEYPVRNSQYAQGNMISFITTIPGYVQVDFSNTGTKDVERYVAVNGVVNTTVGTLNQDRVSSAYIPVVAGEVKIEGRFANYDDGPQYLHFFKIVFGTGDIPTAIKNVEKAAKASKFFQNGQLFILKNGVVYNAQGAIVK